ncbi:MAG TPA: TRAP transporter substrate-binding protein, partial [Bradyrhizobium sp.]|nr:TRAP transporter substrate-binding protein [Bradyrhizobium sp.]
MASTDLDTRVAVRRRRNRISALLVLAAGLLLFAAAAGGLYWALRPVTLKIAVGPPGSDDQKLIQA